jgi:hypothetical protein
MLFLATVVLPSMIRRKVRGKRRLSP